MEADERSCPYCAETIKAAAIKCKHCGSDLGVEPSPGQPPKKGKAGKILLWVVMAPIAVLVFMLALGAFLQATETPESRAKDQARAAIKHCRSAEKGLAGDPYPRSLATLACEKLEREFTWKYGSKP